MSHVNKAFEEGEDRSLTGGQLVPVSGQPQLPQLPSNLNTMSLEDLRQFVQSHQENWLSTSKELVACNTKENQILVAAERKKARRMALYWKNKFHKLKETSETKYNELVQRADPYIRTKRRKVSSFRMKLSTFGGYRLALARNIGHTSASATLTMLDADNTHRTSIVRWERLLAASILFDVHEA